MRAGNDDRMDVDLGPRRPLGLILFLAYAASTLAQTSDDPARHYRRAQLAMASRDYETAAESWQALIALAPDLPEARSNLGLVYHLQRKYEPAIEQFREALKQNPQLLAAKVLLGIDYYLTSRPGRAIEELEGARTLDPGNAVGRKWLAMSYLGTGRYVTAINELHECRRLDPKDHELVFHLSRAYRKLSTKAFLAVRQAGLESPWLFLLRGRQFAQQGNARKALEELRHAARIDAGMPSVHYRIAVLLEAEGRLPAAAGAYGRELANYPAHLRSAAGLIRTLEKLGMHTDARAVQERALWFHRGSPAAAKALQSAASEQDVRIAPAAEDVKRIRESLPSLGTRANRSWAARAFDALHSGQPEKTLQLASSPEANGNTDQGRYWQARAYLELDQPNQALERLALLHTRQPENVEFTFYLQSAAEKLAIEALKLFASLEPESYRTRQLRAEYYAAREENERAIEEYTQALALAPGASQLHLAIGSLYLKQRKYEEALAAFENELRNDRYSVTALNRAGEVYLITGATDQAEKVLTQAIAINPASASTSKTLGRVYLKKGDYAKAVEHLQSALRLGLRNDENLYYHLGRAFRMLGNKEEAEKNLAIVKRLKEARRSIAQERLENSFEEQSEGRPGTNPR